MAENLITMVIVQTKNARNLSEQRLLKKLKKKSLKKGNDIDEHGINLEGITMTDKDKKFEELVERTKGNAGIMTDDERDFIVGYTLSKMTFKDFYNTAFGQCVCWTFVSILFVSIFFAVLF